MKIIIAVHGFPPTHSAGAERRAERMARWLVNQGHQVTVFTVEKLDAPGFRVEKSEQDGITVFRLFYDVRKGDRLRNLYDYPQVGQAFRDIVANEQFDLVHVVSGYLVGPQVIQAARAAGLPVILTLTEYWFMCARLNLIQVSGVLCSGPESDEKCMRCLKEDQRRYRLPAQYAPELMDTFWGVARHLPFAVQMTEAVADRRQTLRAALEAAHLVICPSNYLISKFAEFGFDTERFTFMRQGLSTPAGSKPQTVSEFVTELRLGYIGQIKVHKGVDLAVDAVIRLLESGYKVSLDLWGAENEEPDYVAMLKERSATHPTIRWNGRYTGGKVWEVLAGVDALVIPSRWYENSPNAILEAYEMKLPVIVTNLGGMAELVENEKNGLVFGLNDVDDLHDQIKRLLTEKGLLKRFRDNIPPVKTIDEEMQDLLVSYQRLVAELA